MCFRFLNSHKYIDDLIYLIWRFFQHDFDSFVYIFVYSFVCIFWSICYRKFVIWIGLSDRGNLEL